ncbi:uncharacterized protein LOC126637609 [Myiozetetes cayanensis]|uniref:uncharacterized protein LOC126637609 n=1 Tax=Myiozetetes cayanensis TaxID=478635 RepID=UPI00215F73FB|nr:uncharacterized protein LOC126637609 [Myiozetetes cayanensis]
MDVSTASTVTISTMGVHKVPLDAWGPIGRGLSALLIGRSSATIQGIMVHVGVIDADYTGQICAMVSTPTPPLCIEKGTCIAQLIPFMSCVPRTKDVTRGTGGFGSTGVPQVHWTTTVKDCRPQMTCVLSMAHASPATAKSYHFARFHRHGECSRRSPCFTSCFGSSAQSSSTGHHFASISSPKPACLGTAVSFDVC